MRVKKTALNILRVFAFALCAAAYAQNTAENAVTETDILSENALPRGFYSYKLENGLEIYIQEDFTVPVLKIDYVTRAGVIRQEPETTGFYHLYSRLFWQSSASPLDLYTQAGAGNFKAQCTSSQSRYSYTAAVQGFDKTIFLLAKALKHPLFSDKAIKTEFAALKSESASWAESAGGFINTAVDRTVFSYAPWKKDSGVYPGLFTKLNTEQVRSKLSYIQKNWYVPNQSALFISGPLDAESILETVKKEFADWGCGFSQSTAVQTRESGKKGGRFVLVSKDFSKELNQVLIQYTANDLSPFSNSDTKASFSAAAWTGAYILQSRQTPVQAYNTDISFTADAADSKISIQGLFPADINVKKDNPLQALESLLDKTGQEIQSITETEVENAKKHARLLQRRAFNGPELFIEALSENWAYGGIEYFFTWPQTVENVNITDIQNVFSSPWIFLFVHPSQYKIYETEFAEKEWTLIKPDTKPLFAAVARSEKTNDKSVQNADKPEPLERYGTYTKNLIENHSLSSGIPLCIQRLPNTAWTVCMLNIRGGELKHGFSKKGLESIALLNAARYIENELYALYAQGQLSSLPEVNSEARLFSGSISVSCAVQDTGAVLKRLADFFKNADIIPVEADELYFAEAYKRRTANASLDNQLKDAAMETFFGGTEALPFFSPNADLLPSATYEEIRKACLSLYKIDAFDLILCGGIEPDIVQTAERCFGKDSPSLAAARKSTAAKAAEGLILWTQTETDNKNNTALDETGNPKDKTLLRLEPAFTEGERTVRLRRLFFTDIPAEQAGERPAKLIPTTDFSDPARVYLKSPAAGTEDEALFAALLYEIAYRMTRRFENGKKPPAQSAFAETEAENFSLSSLRFLKVKSKNGIKKAFAGAVGELASDLKNSETVSPFIKDMKSRYTKTVFFSFNTLEQRTHLMRKGTEDAKNPALYIDRLLILDKADKKELNRVFKTYIEKAPLFWIFSADTKRD